MYQVIIKHEPFIDGGKMITSSPFMTYMLQPFGKLQFFIIISIDLIKQESVHLSRGRS